MSEALKERKNQIESSQPKPFLGSKHDLYFSHLS